MAQLTIGNGVSSFDLSPYLEENGYTVRKVNIYDDFDYTDTHGDTVRPIIGYRFEADVKLSAVPEEIIASLNAAMTAASFNCTFTFPHSTEDDTITASFSRPDITVTAVKQYSDGLYWDEKLTLLSEPFYSDDCL